MIRLVDTHIPSRFPPPTDYERGFADAQYICGPCRPDFTGDACRACCFLVGLILLALLALLLLPGRAHAEQRVAQARPGLTGDPVRDIEAARARREAQEAAKPSGVANALAKPFQDLADFINNDAKGAAALAVAIPELQDGNGLACWTAMQTAGKIFDAHPVPLTFKAMTDFQALRLLVMTANKLCDNTACTVVFADGVNVANAAAPISIGAGLPSLQGLCSKIAHINIVPPNPADLAAVKANAGANAGDSGTGVVPPPLAPATPKP